MAAAAAALWLLAAQFPLIDRLQFVNSGQFGPVSERTELAQTITAPADGLSRIDLFLEKTQLDAGGGLVLTLTDAEGSGSGGALAAGSIVREVRLDLRSFGYPGVYRFRFEPVPDSGGRVYAVRLASGNPEAEGVVLRGHPAGGYKGGRLYINSGPTDADLYLAFYHTADADGLLARMEPFRPFPLNRGALFVILFITGAGACGWLLRVMASGDGGEEHGGADRGQN